ncbi:response regulator [Telmatospirillum siberiense]|uniref:Response regulator n=1 Tax=Telmatospirillum siberiense TaxID=382514 RepID=A0A2N3Q079_9PROT|nr:response regulator [Telmatospirillum siberiense]PKU26060.1 response regulator [Telmatospirillum siberiense]
MVEVGETAKGLADDGLRSVPVSGLAPLVAVVEDETIVMIGYQMLFESWGYRVVAAGAAADVLAGLSPGDSPDVIIADYRLRDGQTGVSAIRAIQGAFRKSIPGILITGDTGAERLREAAASGLPILHKPVNGSQLRELLKRSLAQGEE